MKKVVSFGLFLLLLAHVLAHVITGLGAWWQDEHDLSKRLLVYRSVDSIVEFQIPLASKTDGLNIAHTTADGFSHRGHYYNVISLDVHSDTLYIAGLESVNHSFWQADLLAFLNDHLATNSDAGRKASQILKFLLKEYSVSPTISLNFPEGCWREIVRIPDAPFTFLTRSEPMFSPPPELIA